MDEEFVGIMAKRSTTRNNRVVWIGEISNKEKDIDARDAYFDLLYTILKNMRGSWNP